MKTLTLALMVTVVGATKTLSQTPQPSPSDSLFMISVSVGPGWDKTKKPEDQPDYSAHVEWLKQIGANGTLKFGARAGGKGTLIIHAPTSSHARSILEQDAAIRSKMINADLVRLSVFHGGCLLD